MNPRPPSPPPEPLFSGLSLAKMDQTLAEIAKLGARPDRSNPAVAAVELAQQFQGQGPLDGTVPDEVYAQAVRAYRQASVDSARQRDDADRAARYLQQMQQMITYTTKYAPSYQSVNFSGPVIATTVAISAASLEQQVSQLCRMFTTSDSARRDLARILMKIAYENNIALSLTPNVPLNADLVERDRDPLTLPTPPAEDDRCKRLLVSDDDLLLRAR